MANERLANELAKKFGDDQRVPFDAQRQRIRYHREGGGGVGFGDGHG